MMFTNYEIQGTHIFGFAWISVIIKVQDSRIVHQRKDVWLTCIIAVNSYTLWSWPLHKKVYYLATDFR